MLKKDIKQTISSDWILRHDPYYKDMYSMYNICDRSLLNLTPAAYSLLKLFYYNAISINEAEEYLHSHNVDMDLCSVINLFSKPNIPEILIPSSKPFHIESQRVKTFEGFKVPIASTPIDAELLLTHNCNLNCKHCFQSSSLNSDTRIQLPAETWYNIFKQFEECNLYSVVISGGEPLMYKDFEILLRKVIELRLSINILTNGMLITPKNIDIFSRRNVCVTVSVDGHNSQTHDYLRGRGAFEKIETIIKLLVKKGASVNIAHTLHRYNYEYLEDFIKYGINNDIKNISINFIEPEGRASHNKAMILNQEQEHLLYKRIKELSEKYNKEISLDFPNMSYKSNMNGVGNSNLIFCSAGTKRVAVSSDGRLYPCVYAIEHPELEIGDLKGHRLIDLWTNHSWDIFRGGIEQEKIIGCSTCDLKSACSIKNCRIKFYSKESGLYSKPRNCFKDKL